MKKQLLHIHGGMTFQRRKDFVHWLETREISLERKIKWSDEFLRKSLEKKFEIIQPRMPLADNARYGEWVIHFERYVPHLRDGVTLLGVSLGGAFLAKYLSQKKFPRKIRRVILVAPPFDNSLPDEDLVHGFALRGDFSLIEKNCKDVHIIFSPHDDIVPIAHCEKYARALPFANVHVMEHIKSHFQVSEFSEIVWIIKNGG